MRGLKRTCGERAYRFHGDGCGQGHAHGCGCGRGHGHGRAHHGGGPGHGENRMGFMSSRVTPVEELEELRSCLKQLKGQIDAVEQRIKELEGGP